MLSYGGAVLIALLAGAVWDVTQTPALAFVPLALCALALAAITASMWRSHELR
jgi:hypothetical protein